MERWNARLRSQDAMSHSLRSACLVLLVTALTACSAASTTPPTTPGPGLGAPSSSASKTVALSTKDVTLAQLQTSDGSSLVTIGIPPASAAGNAQLTLAETLPSGVPSPPPTAVMYVQIIFDATQTLHSTPAFSFSYENGPSGNNASLEFYDPSIGHWGELGQPVAASGFGTTFFSEPLSPPLMFNANTAYTFALVVN